MAPLPSSVTVATKVFLFIVAAVFITVAPGASAYTATDCDTYMDACEDDADCQACMGVLTEQGDECLETVPTSSGCDDFEEFICCAYEGQEECWENILVVSWWGTFWRMLLLANSEADAQTGSSA